MDPQFYAVRWLTTLFAREFELEKTFRIWDALLADPQRFMFMYCIGTSMVKLVEEQLLASDFAGIMGCLQNYGVNDIDKIIEVANEVRIRKCKGEEEKEEVESTSQSMMNELLDYLVEMMKAGAAIAGEVGDQMKKGWDVMKKKGLPFLSKFAQDTKSKVVSMTENVTQKLTKKEEEEERSEEEEEEEKPKKKSVKKSLKSLKKKSKDESDESEEEKKKKKKKEEKSEEEEEEEEDDIAYL